MLHNISIEDHYFEKQNLVTITKGKDSYDIYACDKCGLKGKRRSLTNNIEVNKKVKPCIIKERQPRPTRILLKYDGGNLGLTPNMQYEVVDCPQEYLHKFKDDVWVFSAKRSEPVRLLPDEYTIINQPK